VAQRQAAFAESEPGIEFTVGGGTINLTWANVENVRVNCYLMDVELVFSRNPFVWLFTSIKPNATADIRLPAGRNKLAITPPDELAKRNVFVEISAAWKTRSQASFAGAMDTNAVENLGASRSDLRQPREELWANRGRLRLSSAHSCGYCSTAANNSDIFIASAAASRSMLTRLRFLEPRSTSDRYVR
jgi:hypothetical protein